ncbi:MAG: hypothetical protein GY715_06350 [Planctomycetes bacterium]|nr:hypothetical protein [Planctomycetota bacterium]
MQPLPLGLLALAVTAGGATASPPSTDEQIAELTDLVGELRSEIQDLRRAQVGDDWLSEQRAVEVRALVEDVLADADTRANLLQGSGAGYDGGFTLGGDGFSMKINGQLQFRYVFNRQDTAAGSTADSTQSGFENRRTKLKFKGHVLDDSWGYAINGAFEDTRGTDGQFELEDVFITKKLGDWQLKLGQFKAPFMREELVSSSRQLAVERSLLNERFNQDRPQGIELSYKNDQWSFAGMFNDGMQDPAHGRPGSRNTGAIGVAPVADTDYAFAGRVQYMPMGTWKQFKDFTSWRGSETGLLLGFGAIYQVGEHGTPGNNEPEDLRLTFDVSYEADGWNLFAAFVWQSFDLDADVNQGFAAASEDNWGFVFQGGFFITDDTELFIRYEYSEDDQMVAAPPAVEDLSVITFGFNKYFNKHGLKWTTDFGFGLEPINGSSLAANPLGRFAASSAGWRRDAPNEDGQFVIRSQLQLLF